MTKTFINVRTRFEGWHCYPGASGIDSRIEFLEHLHRHMFHVTVKISVTHADRELEFFLVKWFLDEVIKDLFQDSMSCESMAFVLLEQLQNKYGSNRTYHITVSEDGENDGVVEYEPNITY